MLTKLILKHLLGGSKFNKICFQFQQKKFLASKLRKPHPVMKPESRFESILNKLFGKYLLLTNVVSSGVLLGSGDYILQAVQAQTGQIKEVDYSRICRMLTVGSLMGPLYHFFYIYLEKLVPGYDFMSVVQKVILDQAIMAPSSIILFFYASGFLENKRMEECNKELIDKFWTIYMADWCVWPIAQYINFQYVPAKYRVSYVYVLTMLCNIFISYVKHDM